MGVKGCGEAGSVGAPAAVINALVDALAARGVTHIDMPATPEKVWRLAHSNSGCLNPSGRREPAGNSAVICKTSIDTASLKSPSCRLAPVRGGLFLASGYGLGNSPSFRHKFVHACRRSTGMLEAEPLDRFSRYTTVSAS